MAQVYLETSFFSACVWNRQDARSIAWQSESRRWWVQQRHHHELCISAEVIRELSDDSFQNRDEALALTVECLRLPITEDVRGLAMILIREKAMPGPAEEGDALHLAASVVHRCEYLVTWNVKHLANPRKVMHLRTLCRRAGYAVPDLVTPEYLWSMDEDEG
jgi:predicted nucleic acid-binding protein